MLDPKLANPSFWSEEDVDFIFRHFSFLENKLSKVLESIPLCKENETAWSPELVSILYESGSLFSSLFQRILCGHKTEDEKIFITNHAGNTEAKEVRRISFFDFYNIYIKNNNFVDATVVIYKYPLILCEPLSGIVIDEGRMVDFPQWWSAYNKLKHSLFTHYHKATLKNALDALASCFLIMTTIPEEEFTKAMLRYEWIQTSYVPEYVHDVRKQGIEIQWIDSKILFGISNNSMLKPRAIEDISPYQGSQRLQKFIGRFNP